MTRRNFKLGFIVTVSLLLCFFQPLSAFAISDTSLPNVVINEIQTNGIGSGTAANEFIELKNYGQGVADISGWKLEYVSSSGIIGNAKTLVTFPEGTLVYSGGFILITPESYLPTANPKLTYTTSTSGVLSASGASVVLVDPISVVKDLVGWGPKTNTIILKETALSAIPADGSSIQRIVINGITQDTDNNQLDFEPLTTPTPQTDNAAPTPLPIDTSPPADITAPPVDTSQPIDTTPPTDTTTSPPADTTTPSTDTSTPTVDTTTDTPAPGEITSSQSYLPILLNELFIDPVSPLTDANDEWIEIYNPNDTEQNLAGYTVYAGTTYAYHHAFTNTDIIPAKGYMVVTSGATSIALSNGGGSVKIVGPTGNTYDETNYSSAPESTAWAKDINGTWVWTTTPTESAQNVITIPIAVSLVASAATTAKKVSTTTKKAATKAVKATTTKAATTKTTAKTTKVLAATDSQSDSQLVAAPTPLPVWLLAVLGVLAVLYSGYEYRFDIANKLYQFRRH
ncbi:MAG: lamin tail domain-containing protein [Candidatus Saccharimonadales bacterium]